MASPAQNEIDEVRNAAEDSVAQGGSNFPAMTYEEGVAYALRWVTEGGESPLEE